MHPLAPTMTRSDITPSHTTSQGSAQTGDDTGHPPFSISDGADDPTGAAPPTGTHAALAPGETAPRETVVDDAPLDPRLARPPDPASPEDSLPARTTTAAADLADLMPPPLPDQSKAPDAATFAEVANGAQVPVSPADVPAGPVPLRYTAPSVDKAGPVPQTRSAPVRGAPATVLTTVAPVPVKPEATPARAQSGAAQPVKPNALETREAASLGLSVSPDPQRPTTVPRPDMPRPAEGRPETGPTAPGAMAPAPDPVAPDTAPARPRSTEPGKPAGPHAVSSGTDAPVAPLKQATAPPDPGEAAKPNSVLVPAPARVAEAMGETVRTDAPAPDTRHTTARNPAYPAPLQQAGAPQLAVSTDGPRQGHVRDRTPAPETDPLRPLVGMPATEADTSAARTDAPRPEPARQTQPQPIARQIVEAVRHGPDGRVELTLSPEELGRVRMAMHSVDGTMVVTVTADRAETQDMLRRYAAVLRSEFAEQGYTQVDIGFANQGQSGTQTFATNPHAQTSRTDSPEFSITDTHAGPVAAHTTVSASGLDLRL